jgi:hypothetical protein
VEFPVTVKGLFRPHYVTWSEQEILWHTKIAQEYRAPPAMDVSAPVFMSIPQKASVGRLRRICERHLFSVSDRLDIKVGNGTRAENTASWLPKNHLAF